MNLSEAVVISASSLWAHKLRSILTLIGMVIGVAAVIAVVSLINGANQYVATRVFRLGAMSWSLPPAFHHHQSRRMAQKIQKRKITTTTTKPVRDGGLTKTLARGARGNQRRRRTR
jgi:putative ABC transport system permease protein